MADPRRAPYNYVEVAEACSTLGLHNVYAVVAEFSVPRRSRGSDYVCNLLLVDPSTDGMQRPVEMLAFAPLDTQLPLVRKPGDIIRLHRVKVQTYHDKPQFFGKVGNTGPPFSFCLFDSNPEAGTQPYHWSSASYHWDEREARILDALRRFVAASSAPTHLAPKSEYVRPIKDIKPHTFVDVVVQVHAFGRAMDEYPNWRVMYVWDGTDALPFPYRFDTRIFDEEGLPQEIIQLVRKLRALPLPLHAPGPGGAQVALPHLGTILPVVVQGQDRLLGSSAPAVGSWVKLRNIGTRVVQGQLQGYYTRDSKWAPWQEDEDAVRAFQHRVQHNEVAGWAPATAEGLLARSRHPDRPLTTLRQILTDTPVGVPRKYRALARVVDYWPEEPAQMCHTSAECGLDEDGAAAEYVYTIKLLLEDATGQLDALLFGPDAAEFFQGLPAQDLSVDHQAGDRLLDSLQRLIGKGCNREGGPWIDVCLKAYYSGDRAQPWQSRQYMIFDTMMQ